MSLFSPNKRFFLLGLLPVLLLFSPAPTAWGEEKESSETEVLEQAAANLPKSLEEARGRARWLYEMVHGSLQVIHRDFFGDGDDEALSLPSQSLDDVFKEMERSWNVEIRWLGVNATKGVNHEPKDRFEEAAAKALLEGAREHEKVAPDRYRYVGVVHIRNQCLKCHDRNRTDVEEKVAGIAISFPLHADAARKASKVASK